MSREALKQALEALYENTHYSMQGNPMTHQDERNDDTIRVIKEALAQPEEQLCCDRPEQMARLGWQYIECPACGSEGARAFPKPEEQQGLIDVALLKENEDGSAVYSFNLSDEYRDALLRFGIMQAIKAGIEAAKELAPDYEGKKEWVGLTTDERANILRTYYADMYDAAEVIEELLKEKNT